VTDESVLDQLTTHLRAHVTELCRLDRDGAERAEVAERKRLIVRPHNRLAHAVRDLVADR
jgi:hypothetical protein